MELKEAVEIIAERKKIPVDVINDAIDKQSRKLLDNLGIHCRIGYGIKEEIIGMVFSLSRPSAVMDDFQINLRNGSNLVFTGEDNQRNAFKGIKRKQWNLKNQLK
jgi:hypothetical protein